jgi:anti-sigma factor RsiW
MRLAASIALVVAGGAGGYLLKSEIAPLMSPGGAPIQAAATAPDQMAAAAPTVPAAVTNPDGDGRPGMEAFAEAAARAHTFYTGESRFPVEMGGEDRGALDSWLSERLGKSVFGPDLSSLGYKLIGGRSMPTATGVGAQYMYENEAKRRLTLFVGAPHSSQETSFSFIQHGDVGMFYWTEGSLAYVLIGQLGHDELMSIAKAVYQDLKDRPAPAQHDAAPAAQPAPAQQPAPPPGAQQPGGGIQPASDVKPKAS